MITTASLTMTGALAAVPIYTARLPTLRLLIAPSRTSATVRPSRTQARVVAT